MAVYLDHNATTPLETEVITCINDALVRAWGNPSSKNETSCLPKKILDESRISIADLINATANEVIFTSGGTEANCLAINSALQDYKYWMKSHTDGPLDNLPHAVTIATEHPSVIKPLQILEAKGELDVTFLNVEKSSGVVHLNLLLDHIRPNTFFISLMLANNETGIINPVKELSRSLLNINKERELSGLYPILLHSDAAQAIGKMQVDVSEIVCDYMTIVGHKFYGPRIGALYVRRKKSYWPAYPMLYGGGQEKGIRPGTENVPLIAGLGKAASITKHNLKTHMDHMSTVKSYLKSRLMETFEELITINFSDSMQLINTISVTFDLPHGIYGFHLLKACKYLIASTASSCHSNMKPSEVLLNSGLGEKEAACTLRLSVGRATSLKDIDLVINDLKSAILKLVPTINPNIHTDNKY